MSPTPLIELQRRLAEAGRIRMGEKGDKGQPKRLQTWRITSPTRELVEQAAGLYGGKPEPWESPTGQQWEVVTTSDELPVLVMPGYSFRQAYEFRTSPTNVERRCDGVEMEDGKPCHCNAEALEGDAACKLITRLTVALPELTTMLGWRLETKGENAARELLASMDLVQGVAAGRPFVPARLRIVERRGAVNGQAVRYVVPVIDVSLRYSELGLGEKPSLGYTPLQALTPGVSVAEGLAEAERSTSTRTARSAAPIPSVDDDIPFGDPVPVPEEPGPSPSPAAAAATPTDGSGSLKPTPGQKKKIGVFISELRDQAGVVTTEQLWANLAKARERDVEFMILGLGGRDEEGVLHFGPLLADLDRAEASRLIDWFERVAEKAGAAA